MAKDTKEQTSLIVSKFPSALYEHNLSKKATEVIDNMEGEYFDVIWSMSNRHVTASLARRIPALRTGLVRCTVSFVHVLRPAEE